MKRIMVVEQIKLTDGKVRQEVYPDYGEGKSSLQAFRESYEEDSWDISTLVDSDDKPIGFVATRWVGGHFHTKSFVEI